MSTKKTDLKNNHSYVQAFEQIKTDILQSQLRAALSVTKELTMLYWRTGKIIVEKICNDGWGAKTIEYLSLDLTRDLPDVSGFSVRNLYYMKNFAECYPDLNSATAVAEIPWGHNVVLMEKLKDVSQRLWYAQQAIENAEAEYLIACQLIEKQARTIYSHSLSTSFKETNKKLEDLLERVVLIKKTLNVAIPHMILASQRQQQSSFYGFPLELLEKINHMARYTLVVSWAEEEFCKKFCNLAL